MYNKKLTRLCGFWRHLQFETLESRRVLAAVAVTTHIDFSDWDEIGGIDGLKQASGGPDGKISLREAIIAANLTFDPGVDEITFDLPAGQDTILLTEGELDITDAVSIDSTDTSGSLQSITIEAEDADSTNNGNGSRIFNIHNLASGDEVTLKGLTLTGGDTSSNGGAILFNASPTANWTLNLENCVLTDNHTFFVGGGGLYANGGFVNISDTIFSENSTDSGNGGGAFLSQIAQANIFDSKFSNNEAVVFDGGGLFLRMLYGDYTEIRGSEFVENNARLGGGIHAALDNPSLNPESQELQIVDTLFHANEASDSFAAKGGGLSVRIDANAVVNVEESRFTDNISSSTELARGGGIAVDFHPAQFATEDAEFNFSSSQNAQFV